MCRMNKMSKRFLKKIFNNFFLVMRTFKIYFLSNFKVYNTVLLTTGTILYIIFLKLIHLTTDSLYLLTISPFPPPPASSKHQSTLCLVAIVTSLTALNICYLLP